MQSLHLKKFLMKEIINSKFDMSINWNQNFKEKLNYFDTQCSNDD